MSAQSDDVFMLQRGASAGANAGVKHHTSLAALKIALGIPSYEQGLEAGLPNPPTVAGSEYWAHDTGTLFKTVNDDTSLIWVDISSAGGGNSGDLPEYLSGLEALMPDPVTVPTGSEYWAEDTETLFKLVVDGTGPIWADLTN